MERTKSIAARIAALAASALAGSAQAADYRMVSTFDNNFPGTQIVARGLAAGVEKSSQGATKIAVTGPEVVPPFEALRPVSAGAFHFLFTNGVYHAGTTSMGMVLDTLSGADSEARRKSGIYEALDKHYAKHNLKVIALPISKASAYNVMLRSPIAGEGDLKGRKIRSTPTYGGVLNLLGASLVVMPPGEVYTSLEKGVVEGATWPALGTLGTRWYEVAKNIARPTFGVAGLMVLVNRDAWTKMPESERALIMAEGRKVEDAWHTEYGRLLELEEKELKAKGAVFTEFGAKFKPQLEQAWSDGIWKLMEDKNGDEARALHALARSKGLSK